MFVIPPYLRFALIAAGLLGGIALWVTLGFWYGIFFLIAAVVLLAGYVFLGTVGPAAKVLQSGDFDKADRLLNLTLRPNWLYATNRAYYYMLKGSVALARKDIEAGEKYLKIAESIDVPTENEKAMLQLQLGQIAASKGNWTKANLHLRKAKEFKITEPALKDQLKQVEQAFAQQNQSKAALRMGKQGQRMMQQSGGKRRRPKMR
jgi:uncharacterized protein HemY